VQWDDINVILEQAVGYLGELKASLAMLVEFFVYVRNIVSVGMNDACARFIAKVKAVSNRDRLAGGIKLSNMARQVCSICGLLTVQSH